MSRSALSPARCEISSDRRYLYPRSVRHCSCALDHLHGPNINFAIHNSTQIINAVLPGFPVEECNQPPTHKTANWKLNGTVEPPWVLQQQQDHVILATWQCFTGMAIFQYFSDMAMFHSYGNGCVVWVSWLNFLLLKSNQPHFTVLPPNIHVE